MKLLVVSLALLVLVATPVVADTLSFARYNCRVVVPAGEWQKGPIANESGFEGLFLLIDPGVEFRSIGLVAGEAQGESMEDKRTIEQFEEGLLERADSIVYRGWRTLGGVKAYEVVATTAPTGQRVYAQMIVAVADDNVYIMVASKIDDDPRTDPVLQKAVDGFQFIQQPVEFSGGTRTSAAERLGYTLGPIVLLIGVAIFFYIRNRRKRERESFMDDDAS